MQAAWVGTGLRLGGWRSGRSGTGGGYSCRGGTQAGPLRWRIHLVPVAMPQWLCIVRCDGDFRSPNLACSRRIPCCLSFVSWQACLLLIAVIAAVYDGTRSLAAGGLVMTSLMEHWSKIAPTSLAAAQGAVARASPLVWDLLLKKLLLVPSWAAFAASAFSSPTQADVGDASMSTPTESAPLSISDCLREAQPQVLQRTCAAP